MTSFLYNVNNKPLSISLLNGYKPSDIEEIGINLVHVTMIMAFSVLIINVAERLGYSKSYSSQLLALASLRGWQMAISRS